MQAAILLPKLKVLDEEIRLRQEVTDRYDELLTKAGFHTTPFVEKHNTSAWAQYTVRVNQRERVQAELKVLEIPTAVHYPLPLNKQPAVADEHAHLPVGDAVAQVVMSLPMSTNLELHEQAFVVTTLRNAAKI